LDHFAVGQVYDVGTSLGSYLLAVGAAEPVTDAVPVVLSSPERWEAADRPRLRAASGGDGGSGSKALSPKPKT
jgi:hypothetical protein